MRAVVKLGGALFRREPNVTALKDMGKILSGFVREGNQLVLVAGGGENARTYIGAARKLGAEESTCDLLGIQITRANAELLRLAMGSIASSKIPTMLSLPLPRRLLERRFLLTVRMWTGCILRIRRRIRRRSSSARSTWTSC